MKALDKFTCPVCGEASFLKEKVKMEGFTVTGKVLVCALCGAEAGVPVQENASENGDSGRRALAELLGESAGKDPVWELGEEDHFCRDCVHFIEHPFKTLCALTREPVEAVQDCPQFTRRNS